MDLENYHRLPTEQYIEKFETAVYLLAIELRRGQKDKLDYPIDQFKGSFIQWQLDVLSEQVVRLDRSLKQYNNENYKPKARYFEIILGISPKDKLLFLGLLSEEIARKAEITLTALETSLQAEEMTEMVDMEITKAKSKVILLNELGIVDHLRNMTEFSNTNKLASLLAAVTGIERGTLQPYLSAMLDNTGANDKNPYLSSKAVTEVKLKLATLGHKRDG